MLKHFAAGFLLLISFAPVFGQVVKTSDFFPRWQPVAKPSRQPIKADWPSSYGQPSAGRWIYPNNPNPRGTFEIRNAIVNQHKVGAWSEPFRFTAKSGWRIKASGHNQKPQYEEDGIVWKITVIDSDPAETSYKWKPGYEQLLTKWDQRAATAAWQWGPLVAPYQYAAVVPYDAVNPRLDELSPFTYDDSFLSLSKLTFGGQYQDVAPPPIVVVSNIPTNIVEVAYCYVTETGLTPLSAPMDATVPAWPGSLPADTFVLSCFTQDEPPMGAMGTRWYVRPSGGSHNTWQAVVSPDCHKPVPDHANHNDWIFPINENRLELWRVTENAWITFTPSAEPKSWLSSLQVAMMDQAGNIEVDQDQQVSCPIIHNFWTAGQQTTFRGIASQVGTFKVSIRHSANTPTYWPVWVNISSYTTVEGMQINAWNSQCSACLVFSGWGSGSFGNEFENCRFEIRNSEDNGQTLERLRFGTKVSWGCVGLGGHTASELKFRRCSFTGSNPIYIENPQSANIVFSSTHAISSYTVVDRRYCVVFADTASTQIEMKDDLYADCTHGGAIFITSGSNLLLTGKIWIDAGFRCLWSVTQGNDAILTINGGKFNIRPPSPQRACLVRSVTFNDTRLYLSNIVTQFDPGSNNDVYCKSHRHNSMLIDFNKSPLVQNTVLYEPTYEQHEQELNRIYGRPVDGLFPRRAKQENGLDFEYTTLTQTTEGLQEVKKTARVHFNSLQYQQFVRRPSWK